MRKRSNYRKRAAKVVCEERYMPIMCHFAMLVYIVLAMLGSRTVLPELFVICSGFYIVRRFSIMLGFCLRHRIAIYYPYAVFVCIWTERYIGWGEMLSFAHWFMLTIGIILFVYVVWPRKTGKN